MHSAVISTALLDQLPGLTELAGYRADGLLTRDAHHRCRGQLDRLFTDDERRAAAAAALRVAAARVSPRCTSWVGRISGRSRT